MFQNYLFITWELASQWYWIGAMQNALEIDKTGLMILTWTIY